MLKPNNVIIYKCHCGWEGVDLVWHTRDIPEELDNSSQENFWVPYCPKCNTYLGEEDE